MFDLKPKIENISMNDGKERKTNIFTKIVYEDDKFQVRRVTKYKIYSELFYKWMVEKPDLVELCPLSVLKEDEPKKQVSIPVIVKKPIVNADMELTDGFFLYEASFKVRRV